MKGGSVVIWMHSAFRMIVFGYQRACAALRGTSLSSCIVPEMHISLKAEPDHCKCFVFPSDDLGSDERLLVVFISSREGRVREIQFSLGVQRNFPDKFALRLTLSRNNG